MASHQTVRLTRGSHDSPDRGVCVMELASMLAGERFSDRPKSVSPVIRNFLRTYNDRVADDWRQDLYAYAARVVGTKASREVERTRAKRCLEWVRDRGGRVPWLVRTRPAAAAGSMAANLAASERSDGGHRRALALVDELIELGDSWLEVPADPSQLVRPSPPHRQAA